MTKEKKAKAQTKIVDNIDEVCQAFLAARYLWEALQQGGNFWKNSKKQQSKIEVIEDDTALLPSQIDLVESYKTESN